MNSCVLTLVRTLFSWSAVMLMRQRSPFRVLPRSPRRSSSRSAARSARAGRGSARGAGDGRSPPCCSQRQAGIPKASASLTKSGLVKSVPKWRPNFLSCFQTIEPYCEFSQITLTIGVFSRTAVSSSWQFMRKPPSPLTVTTLRSGCTSLAAIAVGSAIPMPARPLAMNTVFGSCAGNMRAIHSLCRPTSEISMSSRPQRLADLPQRARRLHRERVVVLGRLEAPEHDVVEARVAGRRAARRAAPRPGG